MSRLRILLLTVVACAAAIGCNREKQRDDRSTGLTSEEAREMCLASPPGELSIDQAIRAQQRVARQLSQKPEEWILVGRAWVRKARRSADPGFYFNVDACAASALDVAPGNVPALGLRSLALINAHKFKEARDVAETIVRADTQDPFALGVLSDALLELGQFEKAAATVQRMVNLRPDMASYSRASYLRWLQGDPASAKAFIRYALNGRDSRDPEPTSWTLVQAATLFWNEGDYDGADAVFAEALKWLPDYVPALVGRARVALSRRQPQEAIALLEKAHRTSPLAEIAWLLGDAREMAGDSAGARRDYERVVSEGRKSDRLTLAAFYATKNLSSDEALRLIEAERAERGGVYVDDAYAWALFRAGRFAEARESSDRAISLGTPDAKLLYHAGAIRLAAGDRQGLSLIQRALALNPQFDWTGAAEAARLARGNSSAATSTKGKPGA